MHTLPISHISIFVFRLIHLVITDCRQTSTKSRKVGDPNHNAAVALSKTMNMPNYAKKKGKNKFLAREWV